MNDFRLSDQPPPAVRWIVVTVGAESWPSLVPPIGIARRWEFGPSVLGFAVKDGLADLAICAAGLASALILIGFLVRRRENSFLRALAGFGVLVLLVGLGHAVEVAYWWVPRDRFAGSIKVLTAVCSWAGVVVMVRVLRLARGVEARLRDLVHRLDAASGLIGRLEAEAEQIKRANLQLANLSATDELTGLKNRRHFLESFEAEFAIAQLEGRSLSLLMLDVDHFKSFNDHLGHRAGDEALQLLAIILREHVRPSDLVARYGGEEFLMLLPETDAATGCVVAERLRAAIAAYPWPLRKVTASFGVATSQPGTLSSAELIEAADVALYRSKAAGRDQVTHRQDAAIEPMLSFVEAPPPPLLNSVA